MPIDFEKFDLIDSGEIDVYKRTVETPMPETSDGWGYRKQQNPQLAYEIGEYAIKVSKVSDNGWSVWRYQFDSGSWEIDEQLDHGLDAVAAQRLGRREAIRRLPQ